MSLKLEWKYLQRTVPRVVTLMGNIKEALREKLFPVIFGGEDIDTNFRKILGHIVNHGGLDITGPRFSAESAYNTYKASIGELVGSILGGTDLNYVGHMACVRGTSAGARKDQKHVDTEELDRKKDMSGGQERKQYHMETRNGA